MPRIRVSDSFGTLKLPHFPENPIELPLDVCECPRKRANAEEQEFGQFAPFLRLLRIAAKTGGRESEGEARVGIQTIS